MYPFPFLFFFLHEDNYKVTVRLLVQTQTIIMLVIIKIYLCHKTVLLLFASKNRTMKRIDLFCLLNGAEPTNQSYLG